MENRITHGQPSIDYKALAEELGKVMGSKQQEWEEKHAEHHRQIDEILAYKPLIIELAEDLKQRREMRKNIMEKVTGALLIGGILFVCGWLGRAALDSLDKALEDKNELKPATEITQPKEER
jgi:hypothetical protein